MRRSPLPLSTFLICLLFLAVKAGAQELETTPPDGGSVDTDRPVISVILDRPVDAGSIFVLVDDMDVTAEVRVTDETLSYEAALPLSPGNHEVIIQGYFTDGSELTLWWSFATTGQASEGLDEFSLGTELTAISSWLANGNDLDGALPQHTVEIIGPSRLGIADGNFALEVTGNLYYLNEEGLDPPPGVANGADIRDILVVSRFAGERTTTEVGVGDISIQETTLTAPGMERRGAYLQQGTGSFSYRLFTANASPVFGIRDDAGLKTGKDENLLGASFDLSGASGLTRLHFTFLTGSDDAGGGFSQGDGNTRSEGQTVGVSYEWNLASGAARGRLEAASASFEENADTTGSASVDDWAYLLDLLWNPTQALEYEFNVQTLGTDFTSIGNPGEINDVRRISLRNGIRTGRNNIDISLSFAEDNLDGDSGIPTTSVWQAGGEDTISLADDVSLLLGVSRETIETDDEPANFLPEKTVTDHLTGTFTWTKDRWSLSPWISRSTRDDQTAFDADTQLSEYRLDLTLEPSDRFTTALTLPQIIVEEDDSSGVEYTDELVSLLLSTQLAGDLLLFDLEGTWQHSDASDSSLDETRLDTSARLALSLQKYFPGYFKPTLSLRGSYSKTKDDVQDTDRDEFILYIGIEILSGLSL